MPYFREEEKIPIKKSHFFQLSDTNAYSLKKLLTL